MPRGAFIISLFTLVAALAIRVSPITSESFHYDAIVYQEAANLGTVANAWDADGAYALRRYHPPLLSYVIRANNAAFGDGAFRARVYSIAFGSVACWLVSLSVLALARRRRSPNGRAAGALAGALFGGLLLCFLPVHLYVSRTANWDAVYSALALAALLMLALHIRRPSAPRLAWAAAFGALAFLTCELGLALVPAFAAVFLVDVRRRDDAPLVAWPAALVVGALVLVALWPAGVIKLDLFRTLRFRYFDSATAERNLPWVAFYTTLFRQASAFTTAAAAGLVVLAVAALRRRRSPGVGIPLAPLIPFVVYAATVVALSTRQRLVYIHHIADVFPPLCVLTGVAFAVAFAAARRFAARLSVAIVAVVLVAFGVVAGLGDDPEVVGPQEHPGLMSIASFLTRHPGSRTFFYYTEQMDYYAPGERVEAPPQRRWTADAIARAKVGDYDFVVSDASMFDELIPNADALERALAPHYRLERVVAHRRSGEAVAWIYSRHR